MPKRSTRLDPPKTWMRWVLGVAGVVVLAALVAVMVLDPPGDVDFLKDPTRVDGFRWLALGGLVVGTFGLLVAVSGVWWIPVKWLAPTRPSAKGGQQAEMGTVSTAEESTGADGTAAPAPPEGVESAASGDTRRPRSVTVHLYAPSIPEMHPIAADRAYVEAVRKALESATTPGKREVLANFLVALQRARTIGSPADWAREIVDTVPNDIQDAVVSRWNRDTDEASFSSHLLLIARKGHGRSKRSWVFVLRPPANRGSGLFDYTVGK